MRFVFTKSKFLKNNLRLAYTDLFFSKRKIILFYFFKLFKRMFPPPTGVAFQNEVRYLGIRFAPSSSNIFIQEFTLTGDDGNIFTPFILQSQGQQRETD